MEGIKLIRQATYFISLCNNYISFVVMVKNLSLKGHIVSQLIQIESWVQRKVIYVMNPNCLIKLKVS